jgi:hypothetical protein
MIYFLTWNGIVKMTVGHVSGFENDDDHETTFDDLGLYDHHHCVEFVDWSDDHSVPFVHEAPFHLTFDHP